MKETIIVSPEKCVGCNACVRNCPAQEANITKMLPDGRFVTTVNADRCISCGECVRTCQHGARDYIDDTAEFMEYIEHNEAALLVAPAIKTAFPDSWKSVLNFFRQKGVRIYDVSLGADICVWAHLRAMEQGQIHNVITQPCAAIVNYIETYQPELLANLSPIHSPVSCEAVYLKKYLNVTLPLAMLSPCIAKKTEFARTGIVEYNVTFRKLKEFFEKHNIQISNDENTDFHYDFDDRQGQFGSVFPRPGGLRDNLWLHNPELNITNSEGVHKVYPELEMYAKMPEDKHPEVFDVLSCEYGCNAGPASDTKTSIFDIMATMRGVEKMTKGIRDDSLLPGEEDPLFKEFDEKLSLDDFLCTYHPREKSPVPTSSQLESVFRSMGKFSETDRNYNCHACGYRSCHDMATAIYRGLNVPDNCIVHAKSVLGAKHEDLSYQHDKLFSMAEMCKYYSDELVRGVEGLVDDIDHMCLADDPESSNPITDSANEIIRLAEELNVMLHETTNIDE